MAQFLLSNARKIILVNKQSQQINIARTILNNNSHNRRNVVRQALIKRSFFSTPFHFESHTMNVPSMGDSITEGTMVEWLKDVGDYAAEDEVIAIVETDKVSVDIRAPVSGTITEILAALDTNVEVGQELVRFDTDGQAPAATTTTSEASAKKEEEQVVVKTEATPTPPASSVGTTTAIAASHGRIPSIRFRHGKRSVIQEILGLPKSDSTGSSVSFEYAKDDLYFKVEKPNFTVKTKSISDEEMELINLGGADDSWEISSRNLVITKT